MDKIRNFCIIAHIDHGKSTLADRLLEFTQTVAERNMKQQLLDKMDLEREKGITIKLAPVRMSYKGYALNLIDTPGHVDFGYEVSRSLAACEGALLVIDGSQGIQAQTLATAQLAQANNLKIIPIINKIDLPVADPDSVKAQIKDWLDCSEEDILLASAKTGQGIEDILETLINKLPPPKPIEEADKHLKALVFDSYYDEYRGIILYVRVFSGQINAQDKLNLMMLGSQLNALEVGYLEPEMKSSESLLSGEIGYVVSNLKSAGEARVGDTLTNFEFPADQPLAGYQPAKTYIFAGIFPNDSSQYGNLKKALAKLSLSDATLSYEVENSPVLGHGFRCGFLGLLHLEIISERLNREYDLQIIISHPSTAYEVLLTNKEIKVIKSASELGDIQKVAEIRELWVEGEIICRPNHLGVVMGLVVESRGRPGEIKPLKDLIMLNFEAPLANLLTTFYDRLKSLTSGYGSLNYELSSYRAENLVRLDFYIAHEIVEALSLICHRGEAQALAQKIVGKLKDIIPRQQFKIALQGAIGGNFIARADIPSFRKDVTAKLYGGDVTRRKKLLEKQKKGKAKLKKIGRVELPPKTFTVLLQRDS